MVEQDSMPELGVRIQPQRGKTGNNVRWEGALRERRRSVAG